MALSASQIETVWAQAMKALPGSTTMTKIPLQDLIYDMSAVIDAAEDQLRLDLAALAASQGDLDQNQVNLIFQLLVNMRYTT